MDGDKYVAMDVHKASVVIGIRDASGKYIMESIVETKAATLLDFVKGLSGTIHLTFEEGTHSAWLYDLLRPHVAECVVCNPRRNKLLEDGNKADVIDVRKLSQLFRAGLLHPVYHGDHGTRALKELAQNYESLVSDRIRVKNRLKAIYRGRGINCEGEAVYQRARRSKWLGQLTESGVRRRAESLYQELESLEQLVTSARKQLLAAIWWTRRIGFAASDSFGLTVGNIKTQIAGIKTDERGTRVIPRWSTTQIF